MKHTPWKAIHDDYMKIWMVKTDNGFIRGNAKSDMGKEKANRIVRACNAHDELVAMLKLASKYVAKMVADDVQTAVRPIVVFNRIEAALAKAEAKQ